MAAQPHSRGDGAGRSAQRGTSGAATGPGGRSAPAPDAYATQTLQCPGGRSAPAPYACATQSSDPYACATESSAPDAYAKKSAPRLILLVVHTTEPGGATPARTVPGCGAPA